MMHKIIARLAVGCTAVTIMGAAITRQLNTGATTTLAGTAASAGSTDGNGSAARFYFPIGVAVDASGTAYVADQSNHVIRRITSAGVVTTFAGLPGQLGSVDGTGSAARFRSPAGIALDAAVNLYVADQGNHTIRKITAAGMVTTLAGQALQPGSDSTSTGAHFEKPAGVAVDAAGNVYVADQENRTIRKITPAGAVGRLAGQNGVSGRRDTAVARFARFNFPTGIAIDASGTLYVADRFNHAIRVIAPSGRVTTLAGNPSNAGNTNGAGTAARFNCPMGIAVDATGAVYVTDQTNHTVRVIR